MSRIIKCGLIQAHNVESVDAPIEQIKKANIDNQMKFVEDAAKQGVQMLCFQEIFTTPYFCAEQTTRWYDAVEKVPDGPTVKLMQDVAKKYGMVLIVPVYEEEMSGVYYNTLRRDRCRRQVSRQISQDAYSARRSGFLGEVLFSAGKSWLSVF